MNQTSSSFAFIHNINRNKTAFKFNMLMTGQAQPLSLYHIFYSFYNIFFTTLRVAAELDVSVLINLSDRNKVSRPDREF